MLRSPLCCSDYGYNVFNIQMRVGAKSVRLTGYDRRGLYHNPHVVRIYLQNIYTESLQATVDFLHIFLREIN